MNGIIGMSQAQQKWLMELSKDAQEQEEKRRFIIFCSTCILLYDISGSHKQRKNVVWWLSGAHCRGVGLRCLQRRSRINCDHESLTKKLIIKPFNACVSCSSQNKLKFVYNMWWRLKLIWLLLRSTAGGLDCVALMSYPDASNLGICKNPADLNFAFPLKCQ